MLPQVQAGGQGRIAGQDSSSAVQGAGGSRIDWLQITDAEVLRMSGSDRHPILRRATPDDSVEGAYLVLDEAELAATDAYEVEDYTRREVVLTSGVTAWVYVGD